MPLKLKVRPQQEGMFDEVRRWKNKGNRAKGERRWKGEERRMSV